MNFMKFDNGFSRAKVVFDMFDDFDWKMLDAVTFFSWN